MKNKTFANLSAPTHQCVLLVIRYPSTSFPESISDIIEKCDIKQFLFKIYYTWKERYLIIIKKQKQLLTKGVEIMHFL